MTMIKIEVVIDSGYYQYESHRVVERDIAVCDFCKEEEQCRGDFNEIACDLHRCDVCEKINEDSLIFE
jgi:hypothetical protein